MTALSLSMCENVCIKKEMYIYQYFQIKLLCLKYAFAWNDNLVMC